MLKLQHSNQIVEKVRLRDDSGAPLARRASEVLASVLSVTTLGANEPPGEKLYPIDSEGVEEFNREFDGLRKELMMKWLVGDPIAPSERLALNLLNAKLESLLQPALPADESEFVEARQRAKELLSILGTQRRG